LGDAQAILDRGRDGPPIHLDLLGGFELRLGARRLDLPCAGERLLAFLALATRRLNRGYVAGKLWSGGTDASTQHCLRSTLWRLQRAAAGVRLIDVSRSHLLLADHVDVDVRRQVAVAKGLLAGGGAGGARANEALLEGELLPDWYEDWVLLERERLAQLRLHALSALAERLAGGGHYGDAVEASFAALRNDPLCERAHEMLISAYLASGSRVEAIRHYNSYSKLVREKFDLTPSTTIRSLIERAVGSDLALG
jgi:DNA-binding SARP family transcriptional activator